MAASTQPSSILKLESISYTEFHTHVHSQYRQVLLWVCRHVKSRWLSWVAHCWNGSLAMELLLVLPAAALNVSVTGHTYEYFPIHITRCIGYKSTCDISWQVVCKYCHHRQVVLVTRVLPTQTGCLGYVSTVNIDRVSWLREYCQNRPGVLVTWVLPT